MKVKFNMRKKVLRVTVLIILVIIFWLAFYQYKEKNKMSNTSIESVTLHFGQQGVKDFYNYIKGNNDNYPNIMSFSEINFQPPNLGTVNIEHAGKTLKLQHIFYIMGTKLGDRTDGIGALDINGGLNKAEFVTSEQAYQGYVALMQELNSKGWQRYYNPWDARYLKEDNFKILSWDNSKSPVSLLAHGIMSDTTQILTFKEWQALFANQKSIAANLYLRDLILYFEINQTPDSKPNHEQYTIRYQIDSAKYKFYTGLNAEQRKMNEQGLRKIYDEDAQSSLGSRLIEEKEIKQAGFHIDENYKDPDMWQYIVEPAY